MKLRWSHAVLYVQDLETMLEFYCGTLGFQITDRGSLAEDGPELVFISQVADEHHQLALLPIRKDQKPSNTINHFAFRVDEFADIKHLNTTLSALDGIRINPLSHGNTLSLYFNDPEGNGIEVFWDTPWHVAQPQGKAWDVNLEEQQAVSWVEAEFKQEAGFGPKEDYHQQRTIELDTAN